MTKLQQLAQDRKDVIKNIERVLLANPYANDDDLWLAWQKVNGQHSLDRHAFFYIIDNV